MVSAKVQVNNASGLHARPATQFVTEASRFKAHVAIRLGQGTAQAREVNAKSIMGVLSLGLAAKSEFEIVAEGIDEAEALQTLCTFVEERICD